MSQKLETQIWAMTGPSNSFTALRKGFYSRDMDGCIDAPEKLPSGSTVENVLTGYSDSLDGRYVIGGLAFRG